MNIGLYLSESSGEVSSVIDLDRLAKDYSALSVVRVFDTFFKSSSVNTIKNDLIEKRLDGIVLAGESPLYYRTNRDADFIITELEQSGVNLNRIGFANIREHAALPHGNKPQDAFVKAKLLVDVAIEKVKCSEPLEVVEVPPKKRVAIIGATGEGIMIAARLLEHGYKVSIIDIEQRVRLTSDDLVQMRASISYVFGHKNIKVFSKTGINDIVGYSGDFTLYLEKDGRDERLSVGAVVVTVGDDTNYIHKLQAGLYLETDRSGNLRSLNRDTMVTKTKKTGIFIIAATSDPASRTAFTDSAALNVMSLLDRDEILYEVPVSQVNPDLCGGCGTCIKVCIFKASSIDEKRRLAIVDAERCRGCGNCVTSCPTGARDLLTYPTNYLHSAIQILSTYPQNGDPKVLYLLCEGCGYPSLDIAGLTETEYPASILPLGVKCGARVDTQLILDAFARGFDGVIIGKCKEDKCENIVGSVDLDRRANLFREILRSRGIDADRLRIIGIDGCEDASAAEEAKTFLKDLKQMEVLV